MPSDSTSLFVEEVDNFMRFTGAEEAKPNSVFIAVMGMTGSGKSSFIRAVTGRDDIEIGHDLLSCTSSVGVHHCEMDEYNVYLIDTPGFDDTTQSDLDILKAVTNYFSVAYANRNYLNGLIYMHRISDNRMGHSKRLNMDMFKALCGEDAFCNVAVVTSMWSTDESSNEFAREVTREAQLKEGFLPDILEAGGILRRLQSTNTDSSGESGSAVDTQSAKELFQELLGNWKDNQVTLAIQHEMVNDLASLHETEAGKVLSAHLDDLCHNYEADLAKIRQSLHPDDSGSSKEGQQLVLYKENDDKASAKRDADSAFLKEQLDRLRADNDAMRMKLDQVYVQEHRRFVDQVDIIQTRWREELAARDREAAERAQYLEQKRVAVSQGQNEIQKIRHEQKQKQQQQQQLDSRRPDWERMYYNQMIQNGQLREDARQAELERMRREMETMRADMNQRIETTESAKRAWLGPLVEGGLGLVGSFVTAGLLCVLQ